VEVEGAPIRLEFVHEARIELGGAVDASLGVAVLTREDLFAEKLLANADGHLDAATSRAPNRLPNLLRRAILSLRRADSLLRSSLGPTAQLRCSSLVCPARFGLARLSTVGQPVRRSSRDAIDLAMMTRAWGPAPLVSWKKARGAYGDTVDRALAGAILRLGDDSYREAALRQLAMDITLGPAILSALQQLRSAAPTS